MLLTSRVMAAWEPSTLWSVSWASPSWARSTVTAPCTVVIDPPLSSSELAVTATPSPVVELVAFPETTRYSKSSLLVPLPAL